MSDDFFSSLAHDFRGRQEKGKLSDWVLENGIVTPNGYPFEFKAHKFLKDIYDDWTPIQAIPKGAQVGVTELFSIKTIYAAGYRKWNIIYTLPADDHIKQFVPSKLNMIVSRNKILRDMVGKGDTTYRKRVGDNFIYYQGTFTDREALMLSADLVVFDERDRSNQEVIKQFRSRLSASEYQGEWSLSNLTSPGHGVDGLYKKSDRKHWHIKCPKCNHEQFLSWPDSIDVENKAYVCKKCHVELPDEAREDGFWVAHETSDISGYWIHHLMCSWIPASRVIEDAIEPGGQAYFHNFVLGLPYRGSDKGVDEDIIMKSRRNPKLSEYEDLPVAMGIDTGLVWHVVIGCEKGIFRIEACKQDEAIALLEKIKPACCVIDLKGDPSETRKLMERFRGKVFGCDYKIDKADRKTIRWGKKDKKSVVYVDRTRIIDDTVDDFTENRLGFINKSKEQLKTYIKHWESLYKVSKEDSMGIDREKWLHHGDDHYTQATCYFKVALSKLGKRPVYVKTSGDDARIPTAKKFSLKYVISGGRKGRHWTQV